ncbi:hypothetical protein BD310DRAFT_932350 [Dichomitus squalens]|uniref:Uncharacterized protein n=1 Tax=Dichomitus squalens TaxID=114155 RepID=A0A4Q9PNW9_9APHY|nr:hypothetical protein BD310DRAFT_932350 [Dichomitus squalens]
MVHQCEGCGRDFKYLTRHRAKCADARDLLAGGIKRHLEEDERRLALRTAKKKEWQARKKAEIAERKTREQAKRAQLEAEPRPDSVRTNSERGGHHTLAVRRSAGQQRDEEREDRRDGGGRDST